MNIYYDLNTKNKSFLEMHKKLKSLGIHNNKFMLAIKNKDLIGVDPFDVDALSYKMKQEIIEECRENIWYFLREIVREPAPGGGDMCFPMDIGNLAGAYCFNIMTDFYVTKPRMTFSTGLLKTLLVYSLVIEESNTVDLFIREFAGNKMSLDIKAIMELLPEYIPSKALLYKKEGIWELSKGNNISIKTTKNHKSVAETIGRASNANYQFFDDFEFIPYCMDLLESSNIPYITNKEVSDKPHCRMFCSVPSKKKNEKVNMFLHNCLRWSDIFFDYDIDTLKNLVSQTESKCIYIEKSHIELDKDEEWLKYMCLLVRNDPEAIGREIYLKREGF